MDKDWTGNSRSTYSILGANNHSNVERVDYDYYATPPTATEKLLEKEKFCKYIWEPACGELHITDVLKKHNYKVRSSDIINRNKRLEIETLDFFTAQADKMSPDIITNPPYVKAAEFAEHALNISMDSTKIALFLKIQFLETKKRRELFEKYPPKKIYVFVNRVSCGRNGTFSKEGGAVCYAWFIWEKGYKGLPQIDWID